MDVNWPIRLQNRLCKPFSSGSLVQSPSVDGKTLYNGTLHLFCQGLNRTATPYLEVEDSNQAVIRGANQSRCFSRSPYHLQPEFKCKSSPSTLVLECTPGYCKSIAAAGNRCSSWLEATRTTGYRPTEFCSKHQGRTCDTASLCVSSKEATTLEVDRSNSSKTPSPPAATKAPLGLIAAQKMSTCRSATNLQQAWRLSMFSSEN